MSTSTSAARWSAGSSRSAAAPGARRSSRTDRSAGSSVGRGASESEPRSPYSSRSSGSGLGAAHLRGPEPVEAGVDHHAVQPGRHLPPRRGTSRPGGTPRPGRPAGRRRRPRGCPWCAGRPPTAGRGDGRRARRRRRGRRRRGRAAARDRCAGPLTLTAVTASAHPSSTAATRTSATSPRKPLVGGGQRGQPHHQEAAGGRLVEVEGKTLIAGGVRRRPVSRPAISDGASSVR